ncbi:MAG TPA: tetratricopeptide repeat protein [Candidatus Methanoperedens sp.]|nr:tetratricopeptide repeat protein [Candidatus Methanoperedens sp.]
MNNRTVARVAAGTLLLVLLCVAVFHEAADFGFVGFDDQDYVVSNPRVLAGLTAAGMAWAARTTEMGSWHPLTWLSLMLDVQLFGPDPRWMHRTSLLLHAANGVVLFLLLRALTGAFFRSLLVAVLFLVHPLHVESAVWVSERKDVLSTFFWLLGAAAYLRHTRGPSPARLAPVVAFLVLALAAKPMPVTFPLTLLLLDFWPLGRLRGPWRGALLEKLPLFLVSAAAALLARYAQGSAGALNSLDSMPLAARLANAAVSFAWYCGKTLWPTDLAFFYPHPGAGAPIGPALLAAVGVVAATLLLLRLRRRVPALLAGWLWYLVTLLPVIGIVQVGVQARADRYAYVPLVGLFLMAAWAPPRALARRPGPAAALGLVAVAWISVLGVAAHAQARHWRDTRSLAERAARVAPSWLALESLAIARQLEGRSDEALALLRRALALEPLNAQLHYNLGWVHERRGEPQEALGWYRRAAAGMRRDAAPRIAAGVVLLSLGRHREAVPWLEEAVSLAPDSPRAQAALGAALLRSGEPERSEAHLRAALRMDPADNDARVDLGNLFASRGMMAEGRQQFEQALRRDPQNRRARNALSRFRESAGGSRGP